LDPALLAVGGFGPLQPYLDDPGIEEVWLNAPSRAANLLSDKFGVRTWWSLHVVSEGHADLVRCLGVRPGCVSADGDVVEFRFNV
jgi:hypothetical protein